MISQEQVESSQKVIYQLFSQALKVNKISPLYLLHGDVGTPLKDLSFFLAKSLVCKDRNPLACNECNTCKRIEEGNYLDFIFIDGSKNQIKLDDIKGLIAKASETPVEKDNVIIFIINNLENSSSLVQNALLKFLEEPQDNVYGFITTNNVSLILPTIVSRSELLSLLPSSKEDLIKKGNEKGLSKDDVEILSYLSSSFEEMLLSSLDEAYHNGKDSVFSYLEAINNDPKYGLFIIDNEIIPLLKDKVSLRYFFDILALAILDMIRLEHGLKINLASSFDLIASLKDKITFKEDFYAEILKSKSLLSMNINAGLILDKLAIYYYRRSI